MNIALKLADKGTVKGHCFGDTALGHLRMLKICIILGL